MYEVSEIIMLLRRNPVNELLCCQTLRRQQVSIDIMCPMGLQIVFNHVVVTHVEGLRHHVVDIFTLVDGFLYTDTDQTTQQQRNQSHDDGAHDDKDGNGRCIVVLPFGMEPLVVDFLQLSSLFQAGIFIVDGVNQLLVISYQAQLSWRDVSQISCQTVESELFQFSLDRYLSPQEILVGTPLYTRKGFFWRMVFNRKFRFRIRHQDTDGRIVVGFHDKRILLSQ